MGSVVVVTGAVRSADKGPYWEGRISREAPRRENSALSVYTLLVQSHDEKQTLKRNRRARS